jgi:hypothetical protein
VTAEEKTQLIEGLNSLLENGWALDKDKRGVTKMFHFKPYTKVLVS